MTLVKIVVKLLFYIVKNFFFNFRYEFNITQAQLLALGKAKRVLEQANRFKIEIYAF